LSDYLQKKGISYEITDLNRKVQAITDKGVFQLDSIKRYQEREMMVVTIAPNKMEASVRFYPPSVQGFKLEKDDIVELTDMYGKKLTYKVYDIYEVKQTDFSCLNQETNGNIELTLITCIKYQKNKRLIVKCIAI
jgi:hypothetical protein